MCSYLQHGVTHNQLKHHSFVGTIVPNGVLERVVEEQCLSFHPTFAHASDSKGGAAFLRSANDDGGVLSATNTSTAPLDAARIGR
eukprot:COSAG01_NODE_1524_length_10019_cov_6.258367_6_plen_85_part_00